MPIGCTMCTLVSPNGSRHLTVMYWFWLAFPHWSCHTAVLSCKFAYCIPQSAEYSDKPLTPTLTGKFGQTNGWLQLESAQMQ